MDYDIGAAFEAIENELIDSMMRNFSSHRAEETKEGYNWSQWQAEELKSLEQYRKKNYSKFNKQFSQINGKISQMLKTARSDGNANQEAKILQAIKNGFKVPQVGSVTSTAEFFKLNDRKLNALIKSTKNDLKKAETAVLRRANDNYRKAIYNAQVYCNTGAGTYEKAVDMACKDMLNAGLSCVVYKNGARHTLSDYADMALKTANKRAYLRGEGEKRAEWGISTVVVNSRQGGCAQCAEYVGKVFIDDVYSNGKKSDGNYPLLSDAIAGGLFHPRCKDSTSTYYEGVTTLQPVTKEKKSEMAEREAIETQHKYADRQVKRFTRREKYSLDPDNKRIAKARKEEWQNKSEKLQKELDHFNTFESGISGKKAERTESNVVDLEYISSKEYHDKFKNITDNDAVNEQIYSQSKAMLTHRNGTNKEDMCLIDSRTGKIVGKQSASQIENGVDYNKSLNDAIKSSPENTLISLHNHASNNPPTGSDFVSAGGRGYKMGIVATHNGKVFSYKVGNKAFHATSFGNRVDKYRGYGYNLSTYEAIIKTLDDFKKEYGIDWREY